MIKVIEIVAVPSGDDIPIAVRQAMVGLVLRVEGPVNIPQTALTNPILKRPNGSCFLIPTDDFLIALRGKNWDAWNWLFARANNLITCIEENVCALRLIEEV